MFANFEVPASNHSKASFFFFLKNPLDRTWAGQVNTQADNGSHEKLVSAPVGLT